MEITAASFTKELQLEDHIPSSLGNRIISRDDISIRDPSVTIDAKPPRKPQERQAPIPRDETSLHGTETACVTSEASGKASLPSERRKSSSLDCNHFSSMGDQCSESNVDIPKTNFLSETTSQSTFAAPITAAILTNPFEVPQILTSRVLIRDVVDYVVTKHKHLNVSKLEVISILRIILSSSGSQTFDSFKDVASLILLIEREIASNRDFCTMLENVSCGFNALNSISNGSFKLNSISDESLSYSTSHSGTNNSHQSDYSSCNGAKTMKCPEPEETFDWKDYMFANVARVNAVDEKSNLKRSNVNSFSHENISNSTISMKTSSASTKSCENSRKPGKVEPTKDTTKVSSNDCLSGQRGSNVSRNNSESSSLSAKSSSVSYSRSYSTGSQNLPPGFDGFIAQRDGLSNPHSTTSSKTSLHNEQSGLVGKSANKAAPKVKINMKDSTDDSLDQRSCSKSVNLDMLPVLQRRISDASKVNCVQCQNGLIPGTGKLEALKCGHVMHKSCVKNNTMGCPSHCTTINKTTSQDDDADKGDWCVVPIKKKSAKAVEAEQLEKNAKDGKDSKKKQKKKKPSLAKSLSAGDKKHEKVAPKNEKYKEGADLCDSNENGSQEEDISITQGSNSLGTSETSVDSSTRPIQPKQPTNSVWKQIDVPTTFESYDEVECPICYHSLNLGIAIELVCKHVFHSHCLNKWYKIQGKSCPLCRKVAMTPNEYPALN